MVPYRTLHCNEMVQVPRVLHLLVGDSHGQVIPRKSVSPCPQGVGAGAGQPGGRRHGDCMGAGTVAIRDVQEALAREQALSFNTVMTVMNRLVDKGLLRRAQGKPNSLYEPAMSRDEFCQTLVRQAAEGLVTDFAALAGARFVEALDTVNPALLDQLSHLLRDREQHDS